MARKTKASKRSSASTKKKPASAKAKPAARAKKAASAPRSTRGGKGKGASARGTSVERNWATYLKQRTLLEAAVSAVQAAEKQLASAREIERARRQEFDDSKQSLEQLLEVESASGARSKESRSDEPRSGESRSGQVRSSQRKSLGFPDTTPTPSPAPSSTPSRKDGEINESTLA